MSYIDNLRSTGNRFVFVDCPRRMVWTDEWSMFAVMMKMMNVGSSSRIGRESELNNELYSSDPVVLESLEPSEFSDGMYDPSSPELTEAPDESPHWLHCSLNSLRSSIQSS